MLCGLFYKNTRVGGSPQESGNQARDCRRKVVAKRIRDWIARAQSRDLRSRRALAMTETELKLIAALASIGLSSQPNTG